MLNLLIITALVVFVIDISGFVEEMETIIARWLKVKKVHIPKPFGCSLCTTWWTGLIYLLIVGKFTIPWIGAVAMFSFLTPVFQSVMLFVRDFLIKMVDVFARYLSL